MEVTTETKPSEKLVQDLLQAIDKLFGYHAGFRPLHAKGMMCAGTFIPSKEVLELTSAPHVSRPSVPVVVRFSNSTGLPTIPDNDANANPKGIAIRFYLADHIHTDIVAHSYDGFPTRTGEEFLEMMQAIAISGADAAKPTAIDTFLADHPTALKYVTAPKPTPTSFAKEDYFGIVAYKFTNKDGVSCFGRFKIRPETGSEHLTDVEAAKRSDDFLVDEMPQRLATGAVKFNIFVQVAEKDDNVSDATSQWPNNRKEIKFGTITLTEPVDANDAEMRKIIFDPIPRVEGIEPSDDPLIALRAAIYLISGRRRRAASSAS